MKTLKTNSEGYNYKYTDIAGIHGYLEESEISYYQYIETVEGNDYVMTVPIIEGKELPARRGCRVVQGTLQGKSNPAQEQGSAITYARRYSLLLAFGLATEDDDGRSLDAVQAPRTPLKQSEVLKVGKDGVSESKTILGQTRTCEKCGSEMVYKEGFNRQGKPYKGYFCQNVSCKNVEWIK